MSRRTAICRPRPRITTEDSFRQENPQPVRLGISSLSELVAGGGMIAVVVLATLFACAATIRAVLAVLGAAGHCFALAGLALLAARSGGLVILGTRLAIFATAAGGSVLRMFA